MTTEQPAEPEHKPLLQVVDQDATPEQVAAIVAVFSALGEESAEAPPKSEWASPARRMRQPLQHGRGGWRASALPR